MSDAVKVPVTILKKLLDAYWDGQWVTRNAAENRVCAHDCRDLWFEDQSWHMPACPFVTEWNELAEFRVAVRDDRMPVVVS